MTNIIIWTHFQFFFNLDAYLGNINIVVWVLYNDLNLPTYFQFPQRVQAIPKIEVQNDQYRPPEPQYPQYTAPPQPQYAPPPQQYMYTQPQQQPSYYQPPPAQEPYSSPQGGYNPPQETYRPPQAISQSSSSGSGFIKTIKNDVIPERYSSTESSPLKRKSFGSSHESSTTGGPLRSSATNYIPVIETAGSASSSKTQKPKLTKVTAPGEPDIKRLKADVSAIILWYSPLYCMFNCDNC